MEPPQSPNDDDEDEEGRGRNRVLFLVFTAVLVILGIWLVNKLADMRNTQNCLESGRKNCVPITVPER
jgi:hypothetical protein